MKQERKGREGQEGVKKEKEKRGRDRRYLYPGYDEHMRHSTCKIKSDTRSRRMRNIAFGTDLDPDILFLM